MDQGSTSSGGMDMGKLSTAHKIVGASSVVFMVLTFLPYWWRTCTSDVIGDAGLSGVELPDGVGIPDICAGVNGLRFPVIIAFLLAAAALVGVVMTALDKRMDMQVTPGQVQLGLGIGGLVFTLLGLVIKPGALGFSLPASWALYVGIVVAAVWAYGGFLWSKESGPAPTSPPIT